MPRWKTATPPNIWLERAAIMEIVKYSASYRFIPRCNRTCAAAPAALNYKLIICMLMVDEAMARTSARSCGIRNPV